MLSRSQQNFTQWILALGAIWTTVMMTPNFSVEPIDLPKMYALTLVAFYAFGNLIISAKFFVNKNYRLIFGICLAYLLQMSLVIGLSGAPFNQQFFGANGRNTGFVTYLALILILFSGVLVSDSKYIKISTYALVATGIISIVYGIMQISGSDPIKWNNPNSAMIGFLGNPDFSSAFLGIFGAGLFGLLFSPSKFMRWQLRLVIIFLEFINLFLILKSHATQGLLIFLVGLIGAVGFYIATNSKIKRKFVIAYATFSALILVIGVLGAVKIGPLASHLYKISVRQRGFYWRAGREMLFSHPFFGIGLDSYGDWYYQKRSANAAFHSIQTSSNAAHNVILDVASGGGFILLALYLVILILVARSAWKILRSSQLRNPFIVAVILSWVAYQVQSIASINQIGLAVWGWLLGGVILGYEINSRKEINQLNPRNAFSKVKSGQKKSFAIVGILGLMAGLIIVQPALSADHTYRNALLSRNANLVISSALAFPEDSHRIIDAANQLQRSNLNKQALDLAKHVVQKYPRNYEGWSFISQVTPPSSTDHSNAIKKMQELNPHDKTIK